MKPQRLYRLLPFISTRLLEAAVEAHPNWEFDGESGIKRKRPRTANAEQSLILDTYPDEARLILAEDEAKAARDAGRLPH